MQVSRRALLAGFASSPFAAPAAALACARRSGWMAPLSFRVVRNQSVIGSHTVRFDHMGTALTVTVAADIAVKFGPLTVFRYSHRSTERWESGRIISISSNTDDDGSPAFVTAKRDGDTMMVTGSGTEPYRAPPNALPASHWCQAMLDGPLINTQNGKLLNPRVTLAGTSPVREGNGASVEAHQYLLRGDVDLDLWYDTTPAWVALRFTARDGSVVEYQRT